MPSSVISRCRVHILSALLAAQCYCSAAKKDGPSLGRVSSPLCWMGIAGKGMGLSVNVKTFPKEGGLHCSASTGYPAGIPEAGKQVVRVLCVYII